MAEKTINIFVTSFPGLGLPRTLSLPIASSAPILALRLDLISRLPSLDVGYIITTSARKEVLRASTDPISSLLPHDSHDFLSLRVSVPLRGGKGGFGSQLRAAGGRMASRKKRNQGENNGSSRNLDGRRLRTVTEAKALAEYLAVKPEMQKKEKEARRKRWHDIVEMTEKKDEEIRSLGKGKVDSQWIQDKEEAAERTREAVLAVMRAGKYEDNSLGLRKELHDGDAGSEMSTRDSDAEFTEGGADRESKATSDSPDSISGTKPTARYFGFDDEDEFLSDDESIEESILAETHKAASSAQSNK